jgi:hypothetical protein
MVEHGKSAQQRLREFQGQLRKMLPVVEGLLEAGAVQEPEGAYTVSQGEHTPGPAEIRYRIAPYGRRNHALYDGEALVTVTAYKRGAVEVKRRFETLEQEIARLKQVLSEVGGEPPGEARRAGAMEHGSRPSEKLGTCASGKGKRNDRGRLPECLGDTQPGSRSTPSWSAGSQELASLRFRKGPALQWGLRLRERSEPFPLRSVS